MNFHTGYYGITQSGKTTMARTVARALAKAKHQVVVFDPVGTATHGGDWPPNSVLYNDPHRFMKDASRMENAHLFIDEADMVFDHTMRENFWLLSRGRHQGLYSHVIIQRPNKVHPSVRSMCSRAFIFKLNKTDRAAILADHGHDDVEIDSKHGSFIMVDNTTPDVVRGNVFSI